MNNRVSAKATNKVKVGIRTPQTTPTRMMAAKDRQWTMCRFNRQYGANNTAPYYNEFDGQLEFQHAHLEQHSALLGEA